MKNIYGLIYYLLAIYLPSNQVPYIGKMGNLRSFLFRRCIKKAGTNIKVNQGVIFSTDIEVGNNVTFNENVRIRRGTKFGSDIEVAPGVNFITESHKISKTSLPINKQGSEFKEIIIEDDVWIGTNAIILAGVKLSKGTVVGANAVVTKSHPPFSVITGVPARQVRSRIDN